MGVYSLQGLLNTNRRTEKDNSSTLFPEDAPIKVFLSQTELMNLTTVFPRVCVQHVKQVQIVGADGIGADIRSDDNMIYR